MKGMFESSEVFEAHATISAGYYMIRMAQESLDKATAQLPIERMVDRATGADKVKLDSHKQYISLCLIDIIEAKKLIECDCTNDEKLLAELQNTERVTT